MNCDNQDEKKDPELLGSFGNRFHRVRITANPADPDTVDLIEHLLTKCAVFRCESSTEGGVSVWSLILDEEYIDDALRGIAVVVAPDYEFFQDNEGKIHVVMESDVYQLSGYAEETALCWEGEELIEFDFQVSRIIGDQMAIQIQELIDENPEEDEDLLARVQDRAWSKVNIYRWGEEDVRDAVKESLQELVVERDSEETESKEE